MDKAKIRVIGRARGESAEEVLRRFTPAEIAKSPARFSPHLPALRETKIEATGIEGSLAWVRLPSGLTFYSPVSHGSLRRQYPYVSDVLPAAVTEDTLLAAIDVVQRYVTDVAWPPNGLVPDHANIIELGAYLGHKTIRFAEELAGSSGRVLAVEMMPENCEILRRNIEVNGFADRIDVMPVGVWKESGTVTGYTKGRQRNSILPIDKLGDGRPFQAQTRTLNEIVDGWPIRPIDLVFVTVNGAELEVLKGFDQDGRDVGAFFIATPVLDDKSTNAEACGHHLQYYGYQLMDTGNMFRVVAKRSQEAAQ